MWLFINNQVHATNIYNIWGNPNIISAKVQKWQWYAKFAKGNCTDYAASRRPDLFPTRWWKDRLWGWNAGAWYNNARAAWVETGKTPKVGAIAVYRWGRGASSSYGHVAIVEKIRDADTIEVTDMNYLSEDVVTRRIVKSDLAIWYIYVMPGYKIQGDVYTWKKAFKPQVNVMIDLVQTSNYNAAWKVESSLINNNTQFDIPANTWWENASDVGVDTHQYHSEKIVTDLDSSELSHNKSLESSIIKIEDVDNYYDVMSMNNAVSIWTMLEWSG